MPTLEQVRQQIDALPHKYIFYTRKEIRYLPQILTEHEKIYALTSGFMNNRSWLGVCTNHRLIFLDRGMFFGLRQVQMNLDRLQTIDSEVGFCFGSIRVWDGASSMSISMVLKSSVAPFVRTVQQAMDYYKRTMVSDLAKAASNASAIDPEVAAKGAFISELERLAKMKTDGILTEEEFATAKARLLAK